MLTAAAAAAAGCHAVNEGAGPTPGKERVVDAGLAANYAADGVYDGFRDEGFFVVRRSGKLFALSAICTHRKCKLHAEPDRSFYCKCHGSTFDPGGKVTAGPATRNLPVLAAFINERGRLLVRVPLVGT